MARKAKAQEAVTLEASAVIVGKVSKVIINETNDSEYVLAPCKIQDGPFAGKIVTGRFTTLTYYENEEGKRSEAPKNGADITMFISQSESADGKRYVNFQISSKVQTESNDAMLAVFDLAEVPQAGEE